MARCSNILFDSLYRLRVHDIGTCKKSHRESHNRAVQVRGQGLSNFVMNVLKIQQKHARWWASPQALLKDPARQPAVRRDRAQLDNSKQKKGKESECGLVQCREGGDNTLPPGSRHSPRKSRWGEFFLFRGYLA